jgi:hypothetical protein
MTMDDDQKAAGRRASRAIVIAAAAALAAVWLVPGTAADENRPPRDFPRLSRPGLMSASDFRSIDGALVDRLPAKGGVVSVVSNAVIDLGLSPTHTVFRSPAGDPFLSEEVTFACVTRPQVAAMDSISRDLETYLGSSGIDFLWAIAPDKTAIERDAIGPLADLLMTCADANRTDMESFAESTGSPLLVGWDELIADPELTYLPGDSHWNSHGAAVFAELIMDRLGDEGLARPEVFERSALLRSMTYHPNGGLFLFMGGFRAEPTTLLESQREDVVTMHESEVGPDGYLNRRWVSTGPDLVEGRTLLLHDSFFYYNDDVLAPYFADLTSVHLASIGTPAALATIDGYDHVIIQQVQRIVPLYVEAIPDAAWITAGRPLVTDTPVP